MVWFVTTQKIPAKSELLVCYGRDYPRSGYAPHGSCINADIFSLTSQSFKNWITHTTDYANVWFKEQAPTYFDLSKPWSGGGITYPGKPKG